MSNAGPANAAIHFQPDGYHTDGPKLMGRQAAGSGFLHGLFRHAGVEAFYCHAPGPKDAQDFAALAAATGARAPVRWIASSHPAALGAPGCLYLPGPGLGPYAFERLRVGERAYSLCGVTHTTASHAAMDAITDLLIAPLRAWDALVCTSRAVRDTVRHLLQAQAEYLRWRLGATRFEPPQLPLIPLGVDCAGHGTDAAGRAEARGRLGIAADDLVVLFVGRLSFHAKAHPLPMYLALERAAGGRRMHLLQIGWFANNAIEAAFRDAGRLLAPSVNLIFLDGRDTAQKATGWAAADVFCSLADNMQETFGLTPIEAMAAGLPVVVSDWDGYRDSVRDGIDGFLIPTIMPPPPLGVDLAARYERGTDSYDLYCGHASQLVAVDTAAAEAAFRRLFVDASLRQQMGEAGRARAEALYDWRHVIAAYQALWTELAERRRSDPDFADRPAPAANPARPDPLAAFISYPTTLLGDRHMAQLAPGTDAAVLTARRTLAMVSYAQAIFPPEEDVQMVIDLLGERPWRVDALLARLPPDRQGAMARGLVWLHKLDVIRLSAST
ncbi:Glycosyl transferases group 1 (plasmid) [Rhodovastum atsumiense]|uniref:glycosyltransferase family 4 protein n=1 Tax=Rhodovastum atsumiense TaxID=504468 RepID=UPI0020248653|nr:glycosyltransferase family 4 protein [Rhodovastum atsumiense]CAH2605500.1 Glycosyl transferases group 1 [Rhodovastum atsumiense]